MVRGKIVYYVSMWCSVYESDIRHKAPKNRAWRASMSKHKSRPPVSAILRVFLVLFLIELLYTLCVLAIIEHTLTLAPDFAARMIYTIHTLNETIVLTNKQIKQTFKIICIMQIWYVWYHKLAIQTKTDIRTYLNCILCNAMDGRAQWCVRVMASSSFWKRLTLGAVVCP